MGRGGGRGEGRAEGKAEEQEEEQIEGKQRRLKVRMRRLLLEAAVVICLGLVAEKAAARPRQSLRQPREERRGCSETALVEAVAGRGPQASDGR